MKLRSYQKNAVDATISHFKKSILPALIVLPTGAGKSVVIGEIVRIAKGRVLVLAHVKELVEQNFKKYLELINLSEEDQADAGLFSAGLNQKISNKKNIFGSIQSVANAKEDFFENFSMIIIDEAHRVGLSSNCQYQIVIEKIKNKNNDIKILGLTATPYRLETGWIFEYHLLKKRVYSEANKFFKFCIFELTLKYLIENKYLTTPIVIDSPVVSYDFSGLQLNGINYYQQEIERKLKEQKRITPLIVKNILEMSKDRKGVMIFTSSISHAKEILQLLPSYNSELVIGDTENFKRDEIINSFKNFNLKFIVNVSVLTTGFDAPHVDLIAILRPTESQSLYQQIVGRGLRLFPEKTDCLVLDYTGQNHNLFKPEIIEKKPNENSTLVKVSCPLCEFENEFFGIVDKEGDIVEHYGRKCQRVEYDYLTKIKIECNYRFRFKLCPSCNSENDIAAKICYTCAEALIDYDKKIKEIMFLKDCHVFKVEEWKITRFVDKYFNEKILIEYFDVEAQSLKEYFYFKSFEDKNIFYHNFLRFHQRIPEIKMNLNTIDEVLNSFKKFRSPRYIIAKQQNKKWIIREKVF